MFAVGSIEELKQGFIEKDGQRVSVADAGEEIDLHKPFVDKIVFEKNGKIYKRTPELIDVWFDSGAMPFAQYHYPFENKELFEKSFFPADFICEGVDQTRGWFYTLHAISTMLFDNVAYKNIVVNELILDKTGQKMSKSKGNTVDPFDLFDRFGADATRWYLVTTSPPWRPKHFDEEALAEGQRKFFGTLVNTYSFFALYANIDKFEYKEADVPYAERPEIDRWIISKLNSLVEDYENSMEEYELTKAARSVSSFAIDHLSNWYVRRCRRRFWKSEMNQNKLSAYQTLYECLVTITKLIAPFAPFIAEELYQNLNKITGKEEVESVHLSLIPEIGYRDKELEEKMEIAQKVVYLTRAMRAKSNLKVRQPLKQIMVVVPKEQRETLLKMRDVVLDEVNIKELKIVDDDSDIVNKSAKANFKTIGPKFGKKVKAIAAAITQLNKTEIKSLEQGEKVSIVIENENLEITRDDVEIVSSEITGLVVESEEGVTVALDTELNDLLLAEGLAREFVNRVQNMRKDAGFDVIDRINIRYNGALKLKESIEQFSEYITLETLAEKLSFVEKLTNENSTEQKLNEHQCFIQIELAKEEGANNG